MNIDIVKPMEARKPSPMTRRRVNASVFFAIPRRTSSSVDSVIKHVSEISPKALIVIKSTVPVGYTEKVFKETGLPKIIFSPEFLREGFAVHDFFAPDRIVIGANSERARKVMLELYKPFEGKTKFLLVGRKSSETIKYASNAFLAMKIHYINEMADFCEAAGANISEVACGMGLDSRIGNKFLNPGPGYGGSCFPKDTNAMAQMAKKFGVHLHLIETTIAYNDERKVGMAKRVLSAVNDNPDAKIAVLGLAFKGGTDDCRESPAMDILRELIKCSHNVCVYDPKAMNNAHQLVGDSVSYAADAYEAAKGADILVILTEWEEFRHLDLPKLKEIMKKPQVVDLRNMLCADEMCKNGFDYCCIGLKH